MTPLFASVKKLYDMLAQGQVPGSHRFILYFAELAASNINRVTWEAQASGTVNSTAQNACTENQLACLRRYLAAFIAQALHGRTAPTVPNQASLAQQNTYRDDPHVLLALICDLSSAGKATLTRAASSQQKPLRAPQHGPKLEGPLRELLLALSPDELQKELQADDVKFQAVMHWLSLVGGSPAVWLGGADWQRLHAGWPGQIDLVPALLDCFGIKIAEAA